MNFFDITIHDYLETLVEWVFEYYLIAGMLFWSMPKKSRFYLRYILGIALLLGLAYPLAIFYHAFGGNVWGRTFVYVAMFAFAVNHHRFCFEGQNSKIIVMCDLSYLLQNITYRIFIAVYSAANFLSGGLNLPLIAYKAVYYLQFFAQAAVIYFTLVPRARKVLMDKPLPRFAIVISAFTVIVSTFLSATQDINIDRLVGVLSDNLSQNALFLLRQSGNVMGALLDAAIIIMLFAASRSDALRKDISDLHHLVAQSAKQYEISQQTIDSINIKCHDMKHRINQIVGGALPEDAIRDINESIAIYDSLIDTGNKALDVIITEKNLTCESHAIAFTKTIDGSAVSFLSEGDLFALFGNLIDNAIEAVLPLEDPEKRYINLSLRRLGEGIVRIECMNYYSGERDFKNGLPKTTKEDSQNHGFGVRSMRQIVQKYSGDISMEAKDGVFSVTIVFFSLPSVN